MIWSCQPDTDRAVAGLTAVIAAELAAAGSVPSETTREIAAAVAAFIRDQHRDEAVTSEYLLLLIARALWAIGEEAAARRWIEARGAEWHVAPAFAEAAVSRDLSLPHWRALLASRAVRSAMSLTRGAIWIVDMRRIVDPARGGLELTVFSVLNAVLDRIAGVWDHSRGQGILGLRHLDAAAALLLGCSSRRRTRAALALEMRLWCEVHLQAAGKSRGWNAVPEVISLDVRSR